MNFFLQIYTWQNLDQTTEDLEADQALDFVEDLKTEAEMDLVEALGARADSEEILIDQTDQLKCMKQSATSAEKIAKSHSNRLEANLFYAVIALDKVVAVQVEIQAEAQETVLDQGAQIEDLTDLLNQEFLQNNSIRLMQNLIKYLEFYKN
jgi:hypothetical protein